MSQIVWTCDLVFREVDSCCKVLHSCDYDQALLLLESQSNQESNTKLIYPVFESYQVLLAELQQMALVLWVCLAGLWYVLVLVEGYDRQPHSQRLVATFRAHRSFAPGFGLRREGSMCLGESETKCNEKVFPRRRTLILSVASLYLLVYSLLYFPF